jgi:hypothetical protein
MRNAGFGNTYAAPLHVQHTGVNSEDMQRNVFINEVLLS